MSYVIVKLMISQKERFDRVGLKLMFQITPLLAWILSDILIFLSNVFVKETRMVSVELEKCAGKMER